MKENTIQKCRHNPQKDKNAISRILFYTFKRKRCEYIFFCAECGAALTWPKLYSSIIAKTILYLFGFFVSFLLCRLMIQETIGIAAAICGILLTRFAAYKVFSILVLAFGRWEKSDKMTEEEKQFEILNREDGLLKTALSLGISSAILNAQQFNMAYFLLFLHGMGVLVLSVRKNWVGAAISLAFAAYSILALLLMDQYSEMFRIIDNVLVLITVILLFLGEKKAYLLQKEVAQ